MDSSVRETRADTIARVVTEVSTPAVPLVIMSMICGIASAPGVRGLLWGAVPAILCGVIPFALFELAARRGALSDRHVTEHKQRPWAYAIGITSVVIGLALVVSLGAPSLMVWALASMLIGALATAAITVIGPKVSVHAFCLAALCTFLALMFSPWWLLAFVILPLVAWSRLRLHHHSPVEVLLGSVVGIGITIAAWTVVPL